MKKKPNFLKKNIEIECDDPFVNSIYTQLDADGLRFLQEDIKVSNEGIIKANTNKNDYQFTMNDFEFSDVLGHGAASTVIKAVHKPTKTTYAVKSINAFDRDKRHQLMNDIKLLLLNKEDSAIKCEFLVECFGAFYDEGSVKLILEYMNGGSLRQIIKKREKNFKIPENIIGFIAVQVLNGLAYIHLVANQIHRDIKPENILFNRQGQIKLTDFGLSRAMDTMENLAKTMVGTMVYMSPERLRGEKYGITSDIWSFGLMMFEFVTGTLPFDKGMKTFLDIYQKLNEVNRIDIRHVSGVSEELKDFVEKTLIFDKNSRPSSIALLVQYICYL